MSSITPDPLQVELDYYKERNVVIHNKNEMLEKENRDAHNQIRELKILLSRSQHPSGKAVETNKFPTESDLLNNKAFEDLIAEAEEKGGEPPNDEGN